VIINEIIALASQDAHAEGYHHRKENKFMYRKVDEPLTPERIKEHLNGTAALGMYILPDGKHGRILVFDFDDKKGEGVAAGPTMAVARTLDEMGVPYVIFRSGGGHGYHIWVFFEEPHHQKELWKFAENVLGCVDVEHEKFVAVSSGSLNKKKLNARGKLTHIEHGVEILPKTDGFQNVAIPCARESVPIRIVKDHGVATFEECTLNDLKIEFVPTPKETVPQDQITDTHRDQAFDFFVKEYNADDRASWGACGLALVAAFGSGDTWAMDKWTEWTRKSPKYVQGDEDQWAGFKPKKYSPLSFWRIATRHGYRGAWPGKPKKEKASQEAVDAFNEKWALINVNGKVEFLNTVSGDVSDLRSFGILTEPEEMVRDAWRKWSGRRQYNGYTFASPEYEGDKWNLFRGWPVEPEDGDASLFEKYVVEMLCDGDKDLAHWVMTFCADAVQRPWSRRPGSGLAIRGPQGSGKSFLGKCMSAALGELTLEISNSDRVMQQFNDLLVGKTVLLCEEAFFTGSTQQANLLKNLITGEDWTFEPKNRKSFTTPNIFRVIATTNNSHAVNIDNDDRRWTIIQSKPHCPHDPLSKASDDWWQPFYDMIDKRPGAILRYLLDYDVDRSLIRRPHYTEAKAEDKITSDPLLQVLIHMVETGACPDDLRGDGRVSSGSTYREVKQRGGRWTSPQALSNELRNRFGAATARNCVKINRIDMRADSSGVIQPVITKRTDYDGLQMPPISVLRAAVSDVTGKPHDGPEHWEAFEPDTPEHVEVGDSEEQRIANVENWVIDNGKVVKNDTPF